MTWRTHLVVGANSIWLLGVFNHLNSALVIVPLAMLASILPDLDASGAKIHSIGGGALSGFKGVFHHRGIMHSLFFSLVFFIILFAVNVLVLDNSLPLLPYAVALSYVSHPIIDGFNKAGVGFLYPFNKTKFSLIPSFLRTPIKGFADNLFFVLGSFGILLFYFIYINPSFA
jgi:membrane-bound metal-dependent hydrolase YbcI (DUF457 family)